MNSFNIDVKLVLYSKNTIQVVNIDILPSTVEEVKESVNNPKKQETEISEHKQSKAKVSPKVQNITKLVETLVPHVATEKLTKNFRLNPNYAIHPLWNPNNSNAEQKSLLVTISKSANNYPLKRLVQRNVARLSSAPASTPQYYPQESLASFNDPKFYDLVQLETLFFIFYFLEGTLSQYYAAKALKKQFWAFHTDQKIWYQRKQEPEEIGEDYEKVYFLLN
ncbi:hypothetical protein A3Q56_03280 [Intoshia linei]|uniref:NOT2/NOT3/NOT5 C-terminal domain-containing protein n=1 Tax=Intoshia linei TaxID=1819745 RepID=A0A177B4C5_9BILA|nr:hypothetical protein A3Q56_03280 [Intoshia linei]